MDLGKDNQRLLISQKERQLDTRVLPGESTQYYLRSVERKEKLSLHQSWSKSVDQTTNLWCGRRS